MTSSEDVPILMVYGSGEENIVAEDRRAWTTYEQWQGGEKADLVIVGLDHDGMTDVPITFNENPILSTLPVKTRAALVADSVGLWLEYVLYTASANELCRNIDELMGSENIDTCTIPLVQDDNDDENLGVLIGVPLTILMFLILVYTILITRYRQASTTISPSNAKPRTEGDTTLVVLNSPIVDLKDDDME